MSIIAFILKFCAGAFSYGILCAALEDLAKFIKRRLSRYFKRRVPAVQPFGSETPPSTCWCHTCRPVTMFDSRMVLCPACGNKRCPRANDHRHKCTGSNDPGQPGSSYPAADWSLPGETPP